MTAGDFISCALSNPANAALLSRLTSLALPQCHVTAGCLFQATWNRSTGHAADWGVKDCSATALMAGPRQQDGRSLRGATMA